MVGWGWDMTGMAGREWGNAKAQGRYETQAGDSRLRGNDGRGVGRDGGRSVLSCAMPCSLRIRIPPPDYGILFNNDGTMHGASEYPQRIGDLLDKIYGPIEGYAGRGVLVVSGGGEGEMAIRQTGVRRRLR